jgi:microcin C transport system substrate-binding protein
LKEQPGVSRPRHRRHLILSLGLLLAGIGFCVSASAAGTGYAFALFGTAKYPPSFDHFDYADPSALKGGELRLFQLGKIDGLNPYAGAGETPSARGTGPRPVDLLGLTFDSLLVRPEDDPTTGYGLIAESVETSSDGRWVVFNIRPQARFHNEPGPTHR